MCLRLPLCGKCVSFLRNTTILSTPDLVTVTQYVRASRNSKNQKRDRTDAGYIRHNDQTNVFMWCNSQDHRAYVHIGIPESRVFTVDPKGVLHHINATLKTTCVITHILA